jgi:hypothetical protein
MKKTLLLLLLILLGNFSNLFAQQVTVTTSKSIIAENESTTITATLDAPASKDVTISLESKGTAVYDKDFKTNYAVVISTVAGGNGSGSNANQLSYPSRMSVDAAGNVYVVNGNTIQKWAPGTTAGTTVLNFTGNATFISVDASGNIYILDDMNSKIEKWAPAATSGIVVAGGNGSGSNANQFSNSRNFFVDTNGSIYITDAGNNRIQKWTPNAITGVTVAGGNGSGAAANQLNYPRAVFVDEVGNIYVNDANNNRIQKWSPNAGTGVTVLQGTAYNLIGNSQGLFVDSNAAIYLINFGSISKWPQGATSGITVAGGNGVGTAANQLNDPQGFTLDTKGNLYIADTGNYRIQKYQYSPQIVIPTGQTSAQLIVSGIEDTMDENDETIILEPEVTNAVLTTTNAISIILTDNNTPPTVSLTFSKEKITENAPTDVTLTATSSNVSGKDVDIEFLTEGTATETGEYSVYSKHISIPVNSTSGSVTISTKGLDDSLVEVLESIIFKIKTITNATATLDSATLYLESNDDPKVSIAASKTTIAENESSIITATIDQASSKDVIIPITFSGTAGLNIDYTGTFPSKGEESLIETFINSGSNKFVQLSDGRYVLANGTTLTIYNPITKTQTTQSLQNYVERIKVVGNVVYYKYMQSISKIDLSQTTPVEVLVVTNNSSLSAFDVVDSTVYYVENNYTTNNRKIYSKTGSATATVVYEPTMDVQYLAVDGSGAMYLANSSSIQKTDVSRSAVTNLTSAYQWLPNISNIKLFNNQLYVNTTEGNVAKIKKFNAATNSFETVDYATTNTKQIVDFSISSDGNLQLLRYDTMSQVQLYNYQLSPQIVIPAGQTSSQLTITGIEDDLETEGTEQIVLKTTPLNAVLNSIEDIKINLLDNTRTLTLKADSPFTGLENGAVAWGDYDRDGDQDVAVMGTGNSGAVTKLYENKNGVFVDTNQNFTRLYGGDISWVDLNKDGWIDLVVSGFNATPQTKVYINNNGTSFNPTTDYGLPQLYSSKMAWGDLDNDGDIDLTISGIDKDENYVFNILYKEDKQDKFVIEPKTINTNNYMMGGNYEGFINGDLKIVDIDLDGDNDIVYNGGNK